MNSDEYTGYYSPGKLRDKIHTTRGSSALGIIEAVITLFILLQESTTPVWVKATIVGALGYFICPFDLIPDFLPMGFTDDLIIITTILNSIYSYRNEKTEAKASDLLAEWI